MTIAEHPGGGTVIGALARLAGGAGARVAYSVLADRGDGIVVRVGDVVVKAHAAGSDPGGLRDRLAVAAHPLLRGILLPPCGGPAAETVDGRAVTRWPYGEPVDRDAPHAAPWEAAGALLARLHTVPLHSTAGAAPGQRRWQLAELPDGPAALLLTGDPPSGAALRRPAGPPAPLPPMRAPLKAALAVARLDGVPDSAAVRTVRRAWERLPEDGGSGVVALCHGDLHLGQLVRYPAPDGGWLLIDVDDLGIGDPAWDLARPAMWFAAGLLEPANWARFLGAYRAAGGVAVPAEGDPWARLDLPARASAVQTAATAVAKAHRESRDLDDAESRILAACERITHLE